MNKIETIFTQECFVQNVVETAQWYWIGKYFYSKFWFFSIISPLEKDGPSFVNKFESYSPKNVLCQVWWKLAQWFWRRILKVIIVFFVILLLSSLEKGHDPSFEQTWIPFTQGCFEPCPNGFEEDENAKSLQTVKDIERVAHMS